MPNSPNTIRQINGCEVRALIECLWSDGIKTFRQNSCFDLLFVWSPSLLFRQTPHGSCSADSEHAVASKFPRQVITTRTGKGSARFRPCRLHRGMEREIAGAVVLEHTIDHIDTVSHHADIKGLTTSQDILLGQGTIRTAVFLVIGIRPAVIKSVRSLKGGIGLIAMQTLECAIGASKREVRITAVSAVCTVMRCELNRKGLTMVVAISQIDTDGRPFFPYHITSNTLGECHVTRCNMPTLCGSFWF